ncbi:MAG: 2-amino-4-hydroxy-6-hydroxymethyldihydropteridine diphosphokinase [Alphaproteobacteria bacterium]|nr:2-amino-4-hydroxy-6-hydroxymethyldihydropteridine diphosphokinase [Alphaproteobacteria bacterium]
MDSAQTQLLVAFGANQPHGALSPAELVTAAAQALGVRLGAEVRLSALYRTPCFPAGAGPDYVNAAALVLAPGIIAPDAALQTLHEIEARFGRERRVRWGARTLDIDLLGIGETVLPDRVEQTRWRNLPPEDQARLTPDRLILPHPRLQDRAFVLVPLADVAADWRHPVLGKNVAEMLAALPAAARAEVVQMPLLWPPVASG